MTPNLLQDDRIPNWLRQQIQANALRAEVLAASGARYTDHSPQGSEFRRLRGEADKLAAVAVPYIYGNAEAEECACSEEELDDVEPPGEAPERVTESPDSYRARWSGMLPFIAAGTGVAALILALLVRRRRRAR